MDRNILIVDDEQDFLDSVRRGLYASGFTHIRMEHDARKAVEHFSEGSSVDVALLDINMPGMSGSDLLQVIKGISPETECIMVSAVDEARTAVECLKAGAYDYLVKPVSREELVVTIHHALEKKRLLDLLTLSKNRTPPPLKNQEAFASIVTRSTAMRKILKEAELHARSEVTVLLTGESGTGKELLAKAIHQASRRSHYSFIPLNMASLSPNLFDAEFFGHTKGAFTGAEKERAGFLEHTDRGTLFLDEIGTLPQELQGKLLRILQGGEYIKVGTNKVQKADVRFVTATNEDLDRLIARGQFRKDLYYRLRGAWVHLPPLRERREDIPVLIEKFLDEFAEGPHRVAVQPDAMAMLMNYDYPGNVRELRSIIQSSLNLSQGRPITAVHLPHDLPKPKRPKTTALLDGNGPVLRMAEVEKNHILGVYERTGNNKAHAAELLDIGLNTLRRKLGAYGME
jgi:DNA-binding NtrC family response regulator